MTLVKSAPKKVLAKKLFHQLKIRLSPKKIGFLGKTFFEISMKRRIFDTPFDLIKEKKFSSHIRVSVYFL